MHGSSNLALLGATPLFERPRTTAQLANRDPERFFSLASGAVGLHAAQTAALAVQLEQELCELHGTADCVTFANACYALILAMKELSQARIQAGARQVILPALTFRGLPHLIRWAGLEPVYCDVELDSHTLSTRCLEDLLGPQTACVLAVDNVNALCRIDELERLTRAEGVPLLLDCVYGVGGSYERGRVGARGQASVFSLHASKLINGFEGGYLTTNDTRLAARLRHMRGNALQGGLDASQGLGLNSQLNELHAAMALSNLVHMNEIVADNATRFRCYRECFADLTWTSFANYERSPGNYGLVLLKVEANAPISRDLLIQILRAENALVRPYYAPALHRAAPGLEPAGLPVTEQVSLEYVQMPVGDLLTLADIHLLRDLFERIDRHAGELHDRMAPQA